MNRRDVVFASLAIGSLPSPAWTQPAAGKVWRVGYLSESWPRHKYTTYLLTSSGYVEGRDFVLDYKFADGRRDRLPALAAELVAGKPDVLIGPLNPEIAALKGATRTIPIVMLYATAPVEMGFVASLAKPGGNVTGTTTNTPELAAKMVQLLRDTVPTIKRIVTFADSSYPGIDLYQRWTDHAIRNIGLEGKIKDVRSGSELDLALASLDQDRPDAIIVAMVGPVIQYSARIVETAARLRIPALYSIRNPVPAGGLMSYAADFVAMTKRNAWQIDLIFKGAKPRDLPVEEPARYLLTINMKTANALGLKIPRGVLLQADEVIQ